MRKIVVFDRVSADGYYSATDGNLNWAVPEPELDKAAAGSLDGAGTMLFGRRTYDMFESFWPNVLGDGPTAPDPHAAGRHNAEMHAMAVWINAARKGRVLADAAVGDMDELAPGPRVRCRARSRR